MTALALLGYITALLMGQVVATIAFTTLRHRSLPGSPPEIEPLRLSDSRRAWAGLRPFRVRSRDDEDGALTQTSFYLEPMDGQPLAPYRAGQFLTFQLDIPGVGGELGSYTRCYSLSDRHDRHAYRITVKRIPPPDDRPDLLPGIVSNHFHDHVMPGAVVQVSAPAGVFVLDGDCGVSAVLIAGGIGITPLFAMLGTALAEKPDRAIHLFYGVRNSRELVFETELLAMASRHPNFQVTIVQSNPLPGECEGHGFEASGFIDVAMLRRYLAPGLHHFYICGPPLMMASLVPELRAWGVTDDCIHFEAFGPASISAAEPASGARHAAAMAVRFVRAERTLDWTGEDANLLEFAERSGVEVSSGCRSGSCGTCETNIVSGTVRHTRSPAFEVAPGRCLLCISMPTSDLVLGA